MAINKNSTGYTFAFSIIMVVIVGASLAFTSLSLKPRQKANAADKQMVDILGAIQVSSSRATAKADFQKFVTERVSIDYNGQVVNSKSGEVVATDATDPFNIDVKKDYRANKPVKGDVSWGNASSLDFPLVIPSVARISIRAGVSNLHHVRPSVSPLRYWPCANPKSNKSTGNKNQQKILR